MVTRVHATRLQRVQKIPNLTFFFLKYKGGAFSVEVPDTATVLEVKQSIAAVKSVATGE